MSTTLVIAGCCGRMGSRIASLAVQDSVFSLSGVVEHVGHARIGQPFGPVISRPDLQLLISDDARAAFSRGDVVIDFTTPASTVEHVRLARALKKAMVIGTTGLTADQTTELALAAREIPIVFSPNMSVGINVLFELIQTALRRLGPDYDVEVVEAHHRQKKDAPSGTAKRLAQLLAEVRGVDTEAIPVHAVRAGDIIGDHTVILAGPAERLELTHRAHSRDVFAQGALKAARFAQGQRPGLYTMADVLRSAAT